MLDQVVVARPFVTRRGLELPDHIELVVTGEDERFLPPGLPEHDFFLLLQVDEPGEDVEEAVSLQHLLQSDTRHLPPQLRHPPHNVAVAVLSSPVLIR